MVISQPYINPEGVRAALDGLIYNASDKHFDALLSLACVDVYLLERRLANSDRDRDLALKTILLDLLFRVYCQQRQTLHMPVPPPNPHHYDLATTQKLWQQDVQRDNYHLRALSSLFARYYCAHLELAPATLAAWGHIAEKTVRRSFGAGYDLLADALIDQEQQALTQLQKQRLFRAMPPRPPHHIGREKALARLEQFYAHQQAICLITGPAGIGKTHLLTTFLHRTLETTASPPQAILWVRATHPTADIVAQLWNQIGTTFHQLTLPDYLAWMRPIIVVDGLHPALAHVIPTLHPALVFVTSTTRHLPPLLDRAEALIELLPFSPQETTAFVRRLQQTDLNQATYNADRIYEQTGGNPAAIKHILRGGAAVTPSSGQIIGPLLAQLASQQQTDAIVKTALAILHPAHRAAVEQLPLDSALIAMPDAIDHLLSWLCRPQQHDLQRLIAEELAALDPKPLQPIYIFVRALSPADPVRVWLLRQIWADTSPDIANAAPWLEVLRASAPHDLTDTLAIALCACYSRLDQPDAFQAEADRLIQHFGQVGNFDKQCRVLHLVAGHHRRYGRFQKGIRILNSMLSNPHNADFNQTRLELLKQFIDLRQMDRAAPLVPLLAGTSWQADVCACEYYYLVGDIDACRDQIERLLDHPHVQARLYYNGYLQVLLAQCDVWANNYEQAIDRFEQALYLLGTLGDHRIHTRAATNFAALLINVGQTEAARHLLSWAQRVQQQQSDSIGLIYTEHNLSLLDDRLSD